MTEPTPETDKLSAARALLHGALADLMTAMGWSDSRASKFVPRQLVTPAGWIETPTVAQAPTAGVAATFQVFVALDGNVLAQVQAQDALLSRGWDAFGTLELDGSRVTVQTAGPGEVDVGGTVARGVVFTVAVRLLTRTLCAQTITTT